MKGVLSLIRISVLSLKVSAYFTDFDLESGRSLKGSVRRSFTRIFYCKKKSTREKTFAKGFVPAKRILACEVLAFSKTFFGRAKGLIFFIVEPVVGVVSPPDLQESSSLEGF